MGENFKQLFEEKWSVVVVTPPSNYNVALILLVEVPVDPVVLVKFLLKFQVLQGGVL